VDEEVKGGRTPKSLQAFIEINDKYNRERAKKGGINNDAVDHKVGQCPREKANQIA